MSYKYILFLIMLRCIKKGTGMAHVRKLVYQKDASEHCRRRVVPSVFLSRHVVEANSELMQFSRLELPYSCFISIRTESGSSIVFVVQLLSDETLVSSCAQNGNQLVVYEMGETFGGYWGALPDNVMRQESPYTKYYTLRTTHKETTPTTEITPSSIEYKSDRTITIPIETKTSQRQNNGAEESISIEVPLVNVSGELLPGKKSPGQAFDFDEPFDLLYDVTSRVGNLYETSILPLIQFSMQKEGEHRSGEQLYTLDYNVESVTRDSRLTFQYYDFSTSIVQNRKQFWKNNWYSNRRLNFKKNRSRLFAAQTTTVRFEKYRFIKQLIPTSVHIKYTRTRHKVLKNEIPILKHKFPSVTLAAGTSASQDVIEEISISMGTNDLKQNEEESKNFSHLIKRISNMKHNFSVYLAPKLSLYYDDKTVINNPIIVGLEKQVNFDNFTRNYQPVTGYGFSNPSMESSSNELIYETIIDENEMDQFSSLKFNNVTPRIVHDKIVNTSQYNSTHIINDVKIKENNTRAVMTENNLSFNDKYTDYNVTSDISVKKLNHTTNKIGNNTNKISVTESLIYEYESNEHKLDTTTKETSNTRKKTALSVNSPIIGSMVNHESWENVVQAAPVMAELLNKSATQKDLPVSKNAKIKIQDINNMVPSNMTMRKKRYIQSLRIFNARPHSVSTGKAAVTTPGYAIQDADMPNFAQLVELHDDEMHGRVAMRYLRQYVGPLLFNVCDYREPKTRHVLLFNSSRIVVAIGNFTMERMTLVVTAAHALVEADARCAATHLECQVSGARVCIDATSACNGVPNCGANDIYDEDRQRCGASGVVQHTVYLAAFTFLAVLLTGLYAVHYWLKRCVPKVSEAFFIYTDGTENVLYLDSIMKSPTDMNDGSKMIYQSNIFKDDVLYELQEEKDRNIFSRLFKKLKFKRKKGAQQEEIIDEKSYPPGAMPREIYSFTELELRKMMRKETVDTSIQTGHSLEKAYLDKAYKTQVATESRNDKSKSSRKHIPEFMFLDDSSDDFQSKQIKDRKSMSDLNILKFTRDARSISVQQNYVDELPKLTGDLGHDQIFTSGDEKELHNTMYEMSDYSHAHKKNIASVSDTYGRDISMPGPSGQTRKHLRFDEQAITINPADFEDDSSAIKRQTVFLGSGRIGFEQDLDTIDEDDEHSGSIGRDFKRFWVGSKGKKGKKKTHISLR